MSLIGAFWHRICEPLDGFLWQRDISHHIIRPLLRNQILASGAALLAGVACYAAYPWIFWFGAGTLCMTWIFWSWARFFLRINIGEYSAAFLRAIFLQFGLRLILIAFLLFAAMAWAKAPAPAILAGMVCGAVLALISYGYYIMFTNRQ